MHHKNRYHTNLLIQYRFGMLCRETTRSIPRSTRQYWNNVDMATMIGYDPDDPLFRQVDFHREFMQVAILRNVAKSLWEIYTACLSILKTVPAGKKLYRKHRELILQAIHRTAPVLGTKRACRLIGITVHQYYYWKKLVSCVSSPVQLCKKSHPAQLARHEVNHLKSYLHSENHKQWPLVARYYQMVRDRAAFMSLSTFYKYSRMLGFAASRKYKKLRKKGIRADFPFQILHVDITIFRPLDNSRVYIQFIVDNYSRAILGFLAAQKWHSSLSVANLKKVVEKYNLKKKPLWLMCDNGSENEGEVNSYLLKPEISIEKVVAQLHVSYSNSMVEAVNKRIKYDFLFPHHPLDFEDTIRLLEKSVAEYNNRFHSALYGYTPLEVLNGKIPEKNLFAVQIAKAKAERYVANRQDLCRECE